MSLSHAELCFPTVMAELRKMSYLWGGCGGKLHPSSRYLHIFTRYEPFMPIKYLSSSHILATLKISCAIRSRHILPIHYLHDTSITPHYPSLKGGCAHTLDVVTCQIMSDHSRCGAGFVFEMDRATLWELGACWIALAVARC